MDLSNPWREDHVRHQDSIPVHVGQDRTESVQTTAEVFWAI